MELSAVPEALVTIRAARDKMKGKSEGNGEPAVSFSGKGKGKWRKPNSAKHLQGKLATCHECGQRGHWDGDPQCFGNRDTKFTTWPDDQSFPDREDSRTIAGLNGLDNLASSLSSNLREHSVCTNSVSQFLLLSLARFIQHAQLILENFVVPVMKNSEPRSSKSDL